MPFWKKSFRKTSRLELKSERQEAGPNRSGIAFGVIVRDEATHIAEWLRFHAAAGVSHFYIYDDGSTDGTLDVVRDTLPPELVTITPWNQRLSDDKARININNQTLAYAHCVANFGARYRWMAMLDIDEFLFPCTASSLPEALSELDHVPLIAMAWKMFGRNGTYDRDPRGVVPSLTTRMSDSYTPSIKAVKNIKCIFDPTRLTSLNVHRPRVDRSQYFWNDAGERHFMRRRVPDEHLTTERMQLNHYYTRFGIDVDEKIQRGGSFVDHSPHAADGILARVNEIERDVVTDTRILDFLARLETTSGNRGQERSIGGNP